MNSCPFHISYMEWKCVWEKCHYIHYRIDILFMKRHVEQTTTKKNSSMLHECKFVESENCTTTLLSMAPPTFSNIQVVVVWKLQHAEQHLLQANVMKYVCCVSVRQLCPIADCVCHVEGKVSIFFACCIAMQLLNTNRLIDDALTNYHPQKNVFNFTMTLGCDGWWWWCVDCCNAVCITIEMAFHVRFMFDSGQPRFFFCISFFGKVKTHQQQQIGIWIIIIKWIII